MKRVQSLFWFLLILTVATCAASSARESVCNAGRELTQALSQEEIAFPPGRYQYDVDIDRTGQVRLPSPQEKPVLEWEHIVPNTDSMNMVVDTEGCTWYSCSTDLPGPSAIGRLRRDGSKDWEKQLPGHYMARPLQVCEGAVIFVTELLTRDEPDVDKVALEAIDLAGVLRWRTEPFERKQHFSFIWRISRERVLLPVSGHGEFNIYSLFDGDLLETWSIPEMAFNHDNGPIELPNGGWIGWVWVEGGVHNPILTRFDPPDYKQSWKFSYPSVIWHPSPLLAPGGVLLVGEREGLRALDVDTGEILWQRTDGSAFDPCGVTPTGNFVVNVEADDQRIMVVDPEGNDVWSHPHPGRALYTGADLIVYLDGSILYGHNDGITLLNADGSERWSLDRSDLGFPENQRLYGWNLNPAPDDRIVACRPGEHGFDVVILSLAPPASGQDE